jgi:hypothetical protein
VCPVRRGQGERTDILIILEICINNLSGTDGHRLLSHQCSSTSFHLWENCIKISNIFSLKMKKLRELRSLYCSIEGQGQETQHMVYPLQNDRLYYNVCLRIKNLAAKLQMAIASHMKLYRVLFVLLVAAKRRILEQICQVASTGAKCAILAGEVSAPWKGTRLDRPALRMAWVFLHLMESKKTAGCCCAHEAIGGQ